MTPESVDIAILTVLPEEYQAVRQLLQQTERVPGSDQNPNRYGWVYGEIPRAAGGAYKVVLGMIGRAGGVTAADATTDAVEQFQPRYVVLCGIAGGIRRSGIGLGDIALSTVIWGYEYGKVSDVYLPRHDYTFALDTGLLNASQLLAEIDPNWHRDLPPPPVSVGPPKVVSGPVGSGDKVIDDTTDAFFGAILGAFPKLVAMEMEAAGCARAIEECRAKGRAVGLFMVRGISDLPQDGQPVEANPAGTATRDAWKRYAASAAAAFVVALIAGHWPVPPRPVNANPPPTVSGEEAKIQAYLHGFLAEIEGRLEEMLSISARETASAVESAVEITQLFTLPPSLPGKRSKPSGEDHAPARVFNNFPEAFAALGNRVLLLGAPGAGKTTTLLQFACTAARERLHSTEKPLPIFASIHRWDQKTPLNAWAHSALPKSLHGMRLDDQAILYLFDGLDELGGVRPVDLTKLEGEKYDPRRHFLKDAEEQLPDASVVISCREQDYQQIGEKAALAGAVTLLPLEPSQVESFLEARNQSALWSALAADVNLFELVRTPLLLILLSMAIGEEGTTEALNTSQLTAATIFDFYIKQRFVHEAIKRPLPFAEQQTRALLGQIAASMWKNWWDPTTELKIADIEKSIGDQGFEFVLFLRSMHFIRAASADTVQFIHLKFRDYCALPALIATLKDADNYVQWRSARALGEIRYALAVPALIEALKDANDRVRYSFVDALVQLGDVAAVPALIEALKETDDGMSRRVIGFLEEIGGIAGASALIETLKNTDYYVRWLATTALGEIGVASVPALIEALKDTDDGVRYHVVDALGKIGDVGTVPALIDAINDKADYVRRRIADVLGTIGDAGALPTLFKALEDGDDDVRWRATRSIEKILGSEGERGKR